MFTARSLATPVFLFVILLAGCDSASIDDADPPAVIAPAAFEVDMFEQPASKSNPGQHLTAALLRYVPVSLTLGVQYLLIPKIVTEGATMAEPVSVDGAWVWTMEKETAQGPFAVELTGRPDDGSIDWTMVISANNPYTGNIEDFVLYRGRTSDDGKEGSWELYYPIDGESANVLDAEFLIESPVEKQITFTVPPSAPQYAGYEVRYARDDNDRIFYWYQLDTGAEHTLTWNPVTGLGSIQSTNYKDGERYCWDAGGSDVECDTAE